MKRTLALMLATALTLGTASADVTSVLANPAVKINLNGQSLVYPDYMPQPQIINDRTMVPSAHTARILGFTTSYDSATQTSTFTKGSTVIRHKMFTDTVNVNGVEKRYEAASQNQKDYMIMPLAMFLDATGTPGQWDGTTRTVTIVTETTPRVLSATTPTAPHVVESGASVSVSIIASANTTNVKLVEGSSTIVAHSSTAITNNDGTKTFTLTWRPTNTGETAFKAVRAVAGTANGFSESTEHTQNVSVIVAGISLPEINNLTLDSTTITVGSDAKLRVYTNDAVQRVRVTNNQNSDIEEVTRHATNNREKIFEVSTRLQRTGTARLTVEVAGEDGKYSSATKTINVDVRTVSQHADGVVEIIDVAVSPQRARPNSTVTVNVITTHAVNALSLVNHGTNEIISRSTSPDSHDSAANEKIWSFRMRIPADTHDQTLDYYVSAAGNNATRDLRFSIYSDDFAGNNSLRISTIDHDTSARVDDLSPVTVYTSFDAVRVEIYDNANRTGHALDSRNSYNSTTNNSRSWRLDIPISRSGRNTYYAFAYDENNNEISRSFQITGNTSGNSDSGNNSTLINRIDVDSEDYYYGDYVSLTVRTRDTVSEVWVEDPSGKRVARTTNYAGSSERRFTLEFRANYESNSYVTYRVYAASNNHNDYENIRIYIID